MMTPFWQHFESMRAPSRIPELLALLEEYWMQSPDMRLAQIICNYNLSVGRGTDPYNLEDTELIEFLKKELSKS